MFSKYESSNYREANIQMNKIATGPRQNLHDAPHSVTYRGHGRRRPECNAGETLLLCDSLQ